MVDNNVENFDIKEELKKLPTSPGIYIMHKKGGEVIYVGKAKNLKNRVRQYFQSQENKTNKIRQMIANIDYFEYIVVDNELESLILESNFIKEYRPRYNTLLKDDKHYPYIKMTTSEDFPRVYMVHQKGRDKDTYFGPYKSSNAVKYVLQYIKKNYKLRQCKINLSLNRKKPYKKCLYHHLNMCVGPCIDLDKDRYDEQIKEVKKLLNGGIDEIIKKFTDEMIEFSNNDDFENAIILRDKITALKEIAEHQKIDSKDALDKDVIGLYRKDNIAMVQIFEVRDGKIIDRNTNILNIDEEDRDSDIMASFLKQYYNETSFLPREIWMPIEIEDKELFDKWLNRDKTKCKLVFPKRGEKDKLIKLASINAKIQYDQKVAKYVKEEKELISAYDTLKKITGVDKIERLESYDISNTAGVLNVASMVVWEGKNFKKNDYRKFRLKTVTESNDYAALTEVLSRRIERYLINDSKFNHMPSIFLMDGGIGQVSVAEKTLEKYDIKIPVIGMVKDDNHRTRGLVYNGVEVDLSNYAELFKFITKIQDETHRFAIEYHRSLRSKEMLSCLKEKKH